MGDFFPCPGPCYIAEFLPPLFLTRSAILPDDQRTAMKPSARHWKALACLMCLVLSGFMTVEAADNRPANDPAGHYCPICAMAHVAIENHPVIFIDRIQRMVAAVVPAEPRPGSRMVVFTGFIRPPPAASIAA